MYKLDNDLKFTWKNRSHPRQTHLLDRECVIPKRSLTIDYNGRCFHCICDGWMPWPVGNLMDFSSIEEIFNSSLSKKLQASTDLNGSFKFCNTFHCGIRKNSKKKAQHYQINIGIDESCNLQCPSCREFLVFHKKNKEYFSRKQLMDHFLNLIENFHEPVEITIGSNGDAFASLIYRDFFYKIKNNKNTKFVLKSNGLLLEKKIKIYPIIDMIKRIEISVDAACEETYKKVRSPIGWDKLMSNLSFINKTLNIELILNFVIQKNNFHDIYPFFNFCKQFNATPNFSLLENWGTWPTFYEHSVEDSRNNFYNEWLIVKSDLMDKKLL